MQLRIPQNLAFGNGLSIFQSEWRYYKKSLEGEAEVGLFDEYIN